MSSYVYLGVILPHEHEQKVLIDHDTVGAFKALHKSLPAPSWCKVYGTDPAWVGFQVQGLPSGPLPLAGITTQSLRYGDTQEHWRAYRDFVQKTFGVDLGDGTLFLIHVDTDED